MENPLVNDHSNIGDNGVVLQMIIQILEETLSKITRFEVTAAAYRAKEIWSFKYIYKNNYINSNLAHQILIFPYSKDRYNQSAHIIHNLKAEDSSVISQPS